MKRNFKFKSISMLLAMVMVTAVTLFPVDAALGTMDETESNNTAATADVSFEDFDNYGYISSSTDVDWWCVAFNETGMANFYLRVPSGCNYNLHVYNDAGTVEIEKSTYTATGKAEIVRCHVKAGTAYRVKIVTKQGYSSTSSYMFRAKNYPDQTSYLFTTDLNATSGVETPLSNLCSSRISGLGFTPVWDCVHNNAASSYSVMPSSDIYVVYSANSSAGRIPMEPVSSVTTYLYGKAYSGMNTNSRGISNFSSAQLSETDLVIFAGPNTGNTHSTYGNLVDQTISKGAFSVLGWQSYVNMNDMLYWLDQYFYSCQTMNAYLAMENADDLLKLYYDPSNITAIESRYWGSSQPSDLMLDVYYGS